MFSVAFAQLCIALTQKPTIESDAIFYFETDPSPSFTRSSLLNHYHRRLPAYFSVFSRHVNNFDQISLDFEIRSGWL